MKIMITGANGFVGSHLLRILCGKGHNIVAVRSPGSSVPPAANSDVVWETIDLKCPLSVDSVFERVRPDQVYHLAGIALTHDVTCENYFQINALGTYYVGESILRWCGESCRLLYVSSAGVYDVSTDCSPINESYPLKPRNNYGASKVSAEMLLWPLKAKGLDFRIARPFNHTGPGQKLGFVSSDLFSRIKTYVEENNNSVGDFLTVRNLHTVRDFTDVRDVVNAYEQIMNSFESGEVVNVASGKGYSIRELIDIICTEVIGVSASVVLIEEAISLRGKDPDCQVGDHTLLSQRTGWLPRYSLVESLKDLGESLETL